MFSVLVSIMKNNNDSNNNETRRRMVDIESKNRISSKSIGELGNQPKLLKHFLESSTDNTFSELLFRLTHEVYNEDKATLLWKEINFHRATLQESLHRDVGMLVAALDYLSNITGHILNPKIIDDLRLEAAADIATRDSLTGLYLRGIFDFSLPRMIQEHYRHGRPLSFFLLDIDDFKKVNDRHGHQAGDEILRQLGKLILNDLRKTDFPARYGGEEIAVILPETSIEKAIEKAASLCRNVFLNFSKTSHALTVSIGVSCIREPDIVTATNLIRQADKALYRAKNTGKNKVSSI